MSVKIARILFLIGLLCLLPFPVQAQNITTVSATIVDPNGLPYSGASIQAQLIPTGTNPTINGQGIASFTRATADVNGTFSMNLGSNAVILPGGTQWQFTVNESPGIAPPAGTGPQQCTVVSITISGASQNVSSTINAGCPALSRIGSSSGTIPGAGSPTSAYTIFPVSSTCSLANYSPTGTTYCALNNITGAFDFSGTDAGPVIQSAITAKVSTGGRFFFKNGTYNINSLQTESTGGYSNWSFAIGFPPNTGSAGNYAEFVIEGENNQVPVDNLPSLQVTGVIFNVTATAISSVSATQVINIFWARPDTTNHLGSQLRLKNFTVRYPNNQRCYEYGVNGWEAEDIDYDNLTADFASTAFTTNVAPCSLAIPLEAFTGTKSTKNLDHMSHLFEFGYYVGYGLQSEHTVFERSVAAYNVIPITYGDATPFAGFVFDQSVWTEITTIQSINGPLLGANMQLGSSLLVHGFNCEILTTGVYAGSCLWTETNANFTSGQIYETFVNATSGTALAPVPIPLFTSNGGLFEVQDSASATNFQRLPAQDTFARPNQSVPGLGASWVNTILGTPCSMAIGSNTVSVPSGSASCVYASQAATTAQDAKIFINTVDANGLGIMVRSQELSDNSYSYVCTSTGGRILRKRVAGVPTSISTTASNCAASNTMELEVIPVGTTNYLYTWYNGVADLSGSDASLSAAGFPGIIIGGSGDSLSLFSGGSLPAFDALRASPSLPHLATQLISTGPAPVITGTGACATNSTQIGGGTLGGSFLCTGGTAASTITITFPSSAPQSGAPHEWHCQAGDATTPANVLTQTGFGTNSCVLTAASITANDKIGWSAVSY